MKTSGSASGSSSRRRAVFIPFPRHARNRVFMGFVTGLAVSILLPQRFGWAFRAVAGWDVAAIVLTALAWAIILGEDAAATRRRAAADDPGRRAVSIVVLLSCAFSLFADTVVMRQVRTLPLEQRSVFVVACVAAGIMAWALTHTSYALRYAHLYYRDDQGQGGLGFPGDLPPDHLDFAYYAFTIGMCFQVSDVSVQTHELRRATLFHALLSFAYNTAILALVLNLVTQALS